MSKTLSAKELAQELNTDGRTVRKFLRAVVRAAGVENPGKGSRWEIDRKDVRKLRTHFNRWVATQVPAPDASPVKDEAPAEDEVEILEVD